MSTVITLPDNLAQILQSEADHHQVSLAEFVLEILDNTAQKPELERSFPLLEEIVAEIKATPPDPTAYHPAQAPLAEALAALPDDPDFDLEEWRREWAKAETEMKTIELADAIRDARP